MGQCGCSQFYPYKVFSIGKGLFLVVEIYYGCEYCETGIMFSIYLMSKEDIDNWNLKPNKKLEACSIPEDFPVVGKEDLIKAAKQIEKENKTIMTDYNSLSQVFEDYGLELLQIGLNNRLNEVSKSQRKRRRARPHAG